MNVRAVILSAVLLLPMPMLADTYYYTGNDFTTASGPYTTSDSVTGSFTIATLGGDLAYPTLIDPTSFSFTDGADTITNLTATSSSFYVATDQNGAIEYWGISLDDGVDTIATHRYVCPGQLRCAPYGDGGGDDAGQAGGSNSLDAGTWTDVAATPEPSSLMLMATGLVGVAAGVRRRVVAR